VTFDLGELQSLSSLALGVLVAFRRAAVRTGSRVRLASDLQPAVREVLHRAELLSLFEAVGGTEARVGPAPTVVALSPERATTGAYPNVEVERTSRVSWGQLVDLEPQVEALLWLAQAAGAGCRTPADVEQAFRPVRNELAELIGFAGKHHRHPILGNPGAYQVAYSKLYDAVAESVAVRGCTC
jgi:hypothetical protein